MVEIFKRNRKGLSKRHEFISKLAEENACIIGWENMKSHYILSITDIKTGKQENEIVLAKGVPIIEKIHSFYDIIEKKLKKTNSF